MFTAIMKIDGGQAVKLQYGFATKSAATAQIEKHVQAHPDAFVITTPTTAGEWTFDEDNNLTIVSPPDPVIEWRKTASVSRADFFLNLMRSGVLTPAETKASSRGTLPPNYKKVLDDMGETASDEADIILLHTGNFNRLHPLIAVMQAANSLLTDEFLDVEIFGWKP